MGYFNVFLYNSIMSIFNLSFVSFFFPSVLVERNGHVYVAWLVSMNFI